MPKISELPLANKLKEEDYIPIVQDGVTKKVKGTHFVTEEEYSLDAFSPTIAANDKAMYKFGEGDNVDFSESAYDGAYKSAILSGNTLVNLCDFFAPYYGTVWGTLNFSGERLKTNTKYLVLMQSVPTNFQWAITNHDSTSTISPYTTTQKAIFTTPDTLDKKYIIHLNDAGTNIVTKEMVDGLLPMLIEYQEGMENWDIPYFTGMKSVRMPVLTTTGKNLFDGKLEIGGFDSSTGEPNTVTDRVRSKNFIKVFDSLLTMSRTNSDGQLYVYEYDENKTFIRLIDGGLPQQSVKNMGLSENTKYVKFADKSNDLNSLFQIEEGSSATTSYEPYKSNILSCLEPVTLGKVGDVQDTLNVLTGEVVERTKEIVLDGTQTVSKWTGTTEKINTLTWNIDVDGMAYGSTLISDKLKVMSSPSSANSVDEEVVATSATSNKLYIRLNKSRGLTPEEVVTNLSQNPIKIQYLLKEKVHKTVDLSGTPFGYKGGHIIKSSAEGSLLPKFEYEVAVSRGAQISQNTSTLIKHDEKITELLKKTAATYINQKAEIAHLLNMSNTLEEVQTIPFIEDDYVNDDCMVDSDMVMDDMELEPEKEIIDNVDTLLINLIYDLIELNDTLDLYEKVELFRQSGLIDKHNYEIIKEKLNPSFKEEDYADINQ